MPLRTVTVLDSKPSHILDFPLTLCQQLWLIFLLPTLSQLLLYIFDIGTDLTVALALINEKQVLAGCLTLGLVYLAPLFCYIIRLTSPPDTKEPRVLILWFILETLAFILFPIRPIQCFAERLFWSIEAIRHEDPAREDALVEFEATRVHVIENYLFFQAFLEAGPQAVLQLVFLLFAVSDQFSTGVVQIVCLLTSLGSVALVTSSYQRYEAQMRGGRPPVWSRPPEDTEDLLLSHALDLRPRTDVPLPRRRPWIKVMDEDDPLGSLLSFTFWFLFLLGRVLCLVYAALFYPWVVLAVCTTHYLFSLLYIFPSPECKTSIPLKILLALVYIFCLIEVGVQFRKSCLFYSLFFTFSIMENLALTISWVLWAEWSNPSFEYVLYVMAISHALAIFFIIIYMKFFKPQVKRLQPS